MSHSMRRHAALVPVLVLAFTFMATGSAHASCAEAIPIQQALDQAQTVFVGTVTDLQHGDRVATFRVDEIWKGDLSGSVVVNGGPTLADLEAAQAEGGDVATSVDRTYELGEQYLVVSHGTDGNALADNACSATQPFTSDLDELRPAGAHAPTTPSDGGGLDWVWAGLTAAVAGAVVAATVLVARRVRRHGPSAT